MVGRRATSGGRDHRVAPGIGGVPLRGLIATHRAADLGCAEPTEHRRIVRVLSASGHARYSPPPKRRRWGERRGVHEAMNNSGPGHEDRDVVASAGHGAEPSPIGKWDFPRSRSGVARDPVSSDDPRRSGPSRFPRPGAFPLLRRIPAQRQQPGRLPAQQPPRSRGLARSRRPALRQARNPTHPALSRWSSRATGASRPSDAAGWISTMRSRAPARVPSFASASSATRRRLNSARRVQDDPTILNRLRRTVGSPDPGAAHHTQPLRQHHVDAPAPRGAALGGDRPLPRRRRRGRRRAEPSGRERIPGRPLRVRRRRPGRADGGDLPLHRSRRPGGVPRHLSSHHPSGRRAEPGPDGVALRSTTTRWRG